MQIIFDKRGSLIKVIRVFLDRLGPKEPLPFILIPFWYRTKL